MTQINKSTPIDSDVELIIARSTYSSRKTNEYCRRFLGEVQNREDATNRQVRIRRLLLQSMMGKAVIRREKMQTLLHHILARRKKLLNVCFITLVLFLSRAENATPKYTRSCCHLGRKTGSSSCVWNTYSSGKYQFILSRMRHTL